MLSYRSMFSTFVVILFLQSLLFAQETNEAFTEVSPGGYCPFWSPDGSFLVYGGTSGSDKLRISKVTLYDSKLENLTPEGGFHPSISTDGKYFSYDTKGMGGEIIRVSFEDGSIAKVTPEGMEGNFSNWSKDGSKIVFDSGGDIWEVPANGGTATKIADRDSVCKRPNWSPDGKKIAFDSGTLSWQNGIVDVFVKDLSSGRIVQLTEEPGVDAQPCWSPDGKWIAYMSEQSGNRDIWIMKNDGTNKTKITSNPQMDVWPRWSPDGRKLAYGAMAGQSINIWIVDLNSLLGSEFFTSNSYQQNEKNSEDQWKYFGLKPQGDEPEIFAPGLICQPDRYEFAPSFSIDGSEFYFTMWKTQGREDERIWFKKQVDEKWSEEKLAPFTYDCFEYKAVHSPDGSMLYFLSKRPLPRETNLQKYANLWVVKKSDKTVKPALIKFPGSVYPRYFSVSENNNIYMNCEGMRGIQFSEYNNGNYSELKPVSENINALPGVSHAFVAPDESYMIVDAPGPSGIQGDYDLFISFKNKDGNWTKPVTMGDDVNSNYFEGTATVTPDGKYLFFSKFTPGDDGVFRSDIYWMRSDIIEKMKLENK